VRTSRLEAFSDGVLAIAITLLVLEIHLPVDRGGDLWHALGEHWPSYAGYVVSFLTVSLGICALVAAYYIPAGESHPVEP
jgi:uncharacterized membrane protein